MTDTAITHQQLRASVPPQARTNKATIFGNPPVRSSEYFRAQARLYRDIAQLLTDKNAADSALTSAAEYLERAQEMEKQEREAEQQTNRQA